MLGLATLGSMSGEGTPPDRFSDHDFFLVVASGEGVQPRGFAAVERALGAP